MLIAFGIALFTLISAAQSTECKVGQVMAVDHGRDYLLTVCGTGLVALRGVEPPLRSAELIGLPTGGRRSIAGGELLGGKNVGPEALAFLSTFVGQRVTLVHDGWRIGDREGRRYAYVFLPDKTFLNAQMILRGFGYADRQGSHPRRDEFIALEATARRSKVGVWSS